MQYGVVGAFVGGLGSVPEPLTGLRLGFLVGFIVREAEELAVGFLVGFSVGKAVGLAVEFLVG
jgi:hypothetical protein